MPVTIDELLTKRADSVADGVLYKGVLDPVTKDAPKSLNEDRRTVRFIMSSEAEDRDNDIIKQDGLDLKEFEKNPVALLHHDRRIPIGKWTDIARAGGTRTPRTEGTLQFPEEGLVKASDAAFNLVKGDVVRACSIGFMPKSVQWRDPEDPARAGYGYLINEADLWECSIVALPSNPQALAKAAGEDRVIARAIVEEVLDHWAKDPRTGMLVPRAEYEEAMKGLNGDRHTVVLSFDGVSAVRSMRDALIKLASDKTDADDETSDDEPDNAKATKDAAEPAPKAPKGPPPPPPPLREDPAPLRFVARYIKSIFGRDDAPDMAKAYASAQRTAMWLRENADRD